MCAVHFIHLTLEMKMLKSFLKLKAQTKFNSFNLVRLSNNSIKGRPKDKHFKSRLKVKKRRKNTSRHNLYTKNFLISLSPFNNNKVLLVNDFFVRLMQFSWVDYGDSPESFLYMKKSNEFLRLKNQSVGQSQYQRVKGHSQKVCEKFGA